MTVHHQRNTTLGQRTDFGNRQRNVIRRHRYRFGVEVTAGDHFILGGEDQRVIRHRIGLNQQDFRGLANLGQTGAHHLRLTAQRVRVLHFATVVMRLRNLAAVGQHMAIQRRSVNLPALAARFVNTRIKRTTRSQRRFGGERAAYHRGSKQIFRVKQAPQRKRRRCLSTVQQRQPLFRRQGNRLEADFFQRLQRRHPLAVDAGFPLTQQRQGHVRQRRQVTGCADGTFSRDPRRDAFIHQLNQRLNDAQTNPGEAAGKAVNLQHHNQTCHGIIQRLTNARRMRQHQRTLQVFQIVRGDPR